MSTFKMPSLGADMEAGELVEWLVKPGDAIKRGDVIAVVETQKGAIEIEVFEDGILEECVVEPGAKLPVGAVMAHIRTSADAAATAPAPARPAPPERGQETRPGGARESALSSAQAPVPEERREAPGLQSQARAPAQLARVDESARVRASPAARRLAQERGIDIAQVKGAGPDGVVTYGDVASFAPTAKPGKSGPYDFAQMRRAIGDAMARSKREIPHYYLSHTIDIGPARDWVAAQNAARAPAERLLLGALYVKAAALAARAYPEFNGFFVDGAFRPSSAIHVGVAISIRGGGLVAPAIHDAADLGVPDLMAKLRDLVARVRAGRFRSSEIADPTITISSLGDRGVESLWGVIYPPQVAIVGFGAVLMRPWASGADISARPTLAITLAADHRASDGHRGALFVERIGQALAQPDRL